MLVKLFLLICLSGYMVADVSGRDEKARTRLLAQEETLAYIQGEIQALKVSACVSKRGVAFTAQMDAHKPILGDKQIIDFDKVTTNVGNAFDNATSMFTAPMDGVYVFEVVVGTNGQSTTDLEIVKNGAHLKRVYGYSYHGWGTSTGSVTTRLTSGDKVYVRQYTYNHGLVGHELTSFSGFMVQPECNFQ